MKYIAIILVTVIASYLYFQYENGDQLNSEFYNNFIRNDGVGELTINMKFSDLQQYIHKNNLEVRYNQGVYASCNTPYMVIKNELDEDLFYVELNDQNRISELFVLSPRFNTYDNIHPRMKIEDLLDIKPNLILYAIGVMYPEEFFVPIDMNVEYVVSSYYFAPEVGDTDNVGFYPDPLENEEPDFDIKEFKLSNGKIVRALDSTIEFDENKEIIFIRLKGEK